MKINITSIGIFPWPVSRECYRRSLAVSSTTIRYSVYVVILGMCLRFKPHWMFQIYKQVIKGHEELTSSSSVMHSYLFLLLDVLYRQAGNLSFWTVRCTEWSWRPVIIKWPLFRELGKQCHQREISELIVRVPFSIARIFRVFSATLYYTCKNIFMALFPWQPIFANMQKNRPKKSDYRDVVLKNGSQVQYFHVYVV